MNIFIIRKSLVMQLKVLVFVCCLFMNSLVLSGATINVPADQPTIQAGIDAAASGDEVVVATGFYFETINFNGKSITVRSSSGNPDDAFIDGSGSGPVVTCANGESSSTVLSGFTITGGSAINGGGMYISNSSSPTITNCVFIYNSAINSGGGMFVYDSEPSISNCSFVFNSVSGSGVLPGGGGMCVRTSSSASITDCIFIGNSAKYSGGGIFIEWSSFVSITNCVFRDNSATGQPNGPNDLEGKGAGILLFEGSTATIIDSVFTGNSAESEAGAVLVANRCNVSATNCVFTGNSAANGGAIVSKPEGTLTLLHCSLSGNSATGIHNTDVGSLIIVGDGSITNSIIWGNIGATPRLTGPAITVKHTNIEGGYSGGVNIIDADPLFADPDGADNIFGTADDNLRLQLGSPSIDSGDSTEVPTGLTTDLDGNPRIINGVVDMGAYESGKVHNITQFVSYGTIQSAIDAANGGDVIKVLPGTYAETIDFKGKSITVRSSSGDPNDTIIDGGGNGTVVTCTSGVDPNILLSGFTITNGFTNVGTGGGMRISGCSATVTHCVFSDNSTFYEGGGISIGGTSDLTLTHCTLSGNEAGNDGGGILIKGTSDLTLTHCTLSNNKADTNDGRNSSGGGISMAGNGVLTLTHCTLSDNSAYYGGGVYAQDSSELTFTNCTLSGNSAFDSGGGISMAGNSVLTLASCVLRGNSISLFGGGMYAQDSSDLTLTNCTLSGNSAAFGGGVYIKDSSDLTLTNCTLSGNSANNRGNALSANGSSSSLLTNCIVWGNPGSNSQIHGSGITINYSNIQGGYSGTNNINADPSFVDANGADNQSGTLDDNLRIRLNSPSINSGDNTAVPVGIITDLDGNSRIVDGVVDMGAYESAYDKIHNITQLTDYSTIQLAIDDANNGDIIEVLPGTYVETIDFKGKSITVRSSSGDPSNTIIDGGGNGSVVTCVSGEDPNTLLSGFTITGGSAAEGAGMYISNSSYPAVTHCIFSGNSASFEGGGMFVSTSSSVSITNSVFSGNFAYYGGGVILNFSSSASITQSVFSGNLAAIEGGGILVDNTSDLILTNCTLNGNSDNFWKGGGLNVIGNSSSLLTNCIVWGSNSSGASPIIGSGITINHSNIQGGYSGTNNISANPHFVDADGLDDVLGTPDDNLRLEVTSPSINSGDNTAIPVGIITDLDGNSRIVDGVVDMGAYESEDDRVHNITQDIYYSTIQLAIDGAMGGDVIEVLPGTYIETFDFKGKSITVRSSSGDPTNTIVDGGGNGPVVTCASGEDPNTLLSGLTITGGSAGAVGGGMYIFGSSPTVTHCIFSGNSAFNGGGLFIGSNSSASITDCIFNTNTASTIGGGGALFIGNSNSVSVTHCIFSGNSAASGGGLSIGNSNSTSVTNCIFSGNSAGGFGGAIYSFSSASSITIITNCTLSGNSASADGSGIFTDGSAHSLITNSIVWGNTGGSSQLIGSGITVNHSNIEGGWGGSGTNNINADPLFVDADGLDNVLGTSDDNVRLQAGSPSTDTGDNTAVPAGVTTDLDGTVRILNGTVDMGAYEAAVEIVRNITQWIVYGTIQSAIDDSNAGDIIEADPGTYFESINFNGKSITVRSSSSDPTNTIIDGGGNGSVVTCNNGEDSNTLLSGFTITGGSAGNGGGMAIVGSSPTVTHCIFANNSSGGGSGMYLRNSSSNITHCIFNNNTSSGFGPGMLVSDSSVNVTHCTFYNNSTSGFGGGVGLLSGSASFTNCLFSGNSSNLGGGGAYAFDGTHAFTNCTFSGNVNNTLGSGLYVFEGTGPTPQVSIMNSIFWGNTGGPQVNGPSAALVVNHSNIEGGWNGSGVNNINQDPLFVDADGTDDVLGTLDDNVRLQAGSPCIDAGDNTAVPVGITIDLDDQLRILNHTVDMGAYESQIGCNLLGDINCDGIVDLLDLSLLADHWLSTTYIGDINSDGIVDLLDLSLLAGNWLATI